MAAKENSSSAIGSTAATEKNASAANPHPATRPSRAAAPISARVASPPRELAPGKVSVDPNPKSLNLRGHRLVHFTRVEINQHRTQKSKNRGINKSSVGADLRPQHPNHHARNQVADAIHRRQHPKSRTAHILRQYLRRQRFLHRLLRRIVNSGDAK